MSKTTTTHAVLWSSNPYKLPKVPYGVILINHGGPSPQLLSLNRSFEGVETFYPGCSYRGGRPRGGVNRA